MDVSLGTCVINNNDPLDEKHNAPVTHLAIAVCGCGNDGRLGLGSFDSQSRISLTPFFLPSDGDRESFCRIIAVRVGGFHNFVITSVAVYGWGLNENGQLGLGRGSAACVPLPTRIPFFDDVRVIDIECGAYHTFAWTADGLFACGKNDDGQLGLPNDADRFYFTTVLTDAQTNNTLSTGTEDNVGFRMLQRGQLTHVSCGSHHTLIALRDVLVAENYEGTTRQRKLPLLVAAAGKGDFGELGYDGDRWSVLQTKAKTLKSALHTELQRFQEQKNDPTELTVSDLKGKWKPLKKRRSVFSSFDFQPVELPILTEHTAVMNACFYDVFSLHAMHLHSAVVLQKMNAMGETDALDGAKRTFHWGCYYCGAVEDDASSIPREVEKGGPFLHAGNETLFRYYNKISAHTTRTNDVNSLYGPVVEVIGSGAIGLGNEDSYATDWTPLPLPPEASGLSVKKISGREHYFILLDNKLVLGFGDNLHGQVGVEGEKDVVLQPTIVFQAGDCINSHGFDGATSKWTVEAICDVACGLRHSVCLVKVSHVCSAGNAQIHSV